MEFRAATWVRSTNGGRLGLTGGGGGGNALVGFSTAYANYFLMAPSEAYAPFIDVVKEKIHMAKVLIEFLQNNQDATYEDLLNKIQVALCYGKK